MFDGYKPSKNYIHIYTMYTYLQTRNAHILLKKNIINDEND